MVGHRFFPPPPLEGRPVCFASSRGPHFANSPAAASEMKMPAAGSKTKPRFIGYNPIFYCLCWPNSMINNCKFTDISLVVLFGLLLGFTNCTVTAQETPTFHSSSSLVLIDVIAQDKKT